MFKINNKDTTASLLVGLVLINLSCKIMNEEIKGTVVQIL